MAELDFKSAFELAVQITEKNCSRLTEFPHTTIDGEWLQSKHGRWTAGFWVGMLWMSYLATEDDVWKVRAKTWARRLESRRFDRFTHDMGFLFQPSFIRGFAITGDDYYKDIALCAAASHASRYHPKGKYLPAWDVSEDPKFAGRTIVDTAMNLPILYWAARHSGNDEYKRIADEIAETIRNHHIRHDGSTWHVVDFDANRGVPMAYTTHQGYAANSCWSRGHAWAIYGFSQIYSQTRNPLDLAAAKRMADYFVAHLPEDRVPYWDFSAPNIPYEPRDSAAAAIAATGLLELDAVQGGGTSYADVAKDILRELVRNYMNLDRTAEVEQGILLHGAVDVPRQSAIDASIIYGDHYFMEGLFKLLHRDKWQTMLGACI